jgi:cardiolipin synthase
MSDHVQPAVRSAPGDAVLTVPNILTVFRLCLIPVFLWVCLGPRRLGIGALVALAGVVTDLVDGPIARRFRQVSRLGILLDPVSDRLGLASAAAVLIALRLAPLWLVLLIVVRDGALVLVGGPILKARNAPIPPVTWLGKRASFAVTTAMALFLVSGIRHGGLPPVHTFRLAGWWASAVAVPAYYASTMQYVRAGVSALRAR